MILIIGPIIFGLFWFLIGLYFGLSFIYIFLHFIFPKIKAGFLIPLILALIIGFIVGYWGYRHAEIQSTIQNSDNQQFLKDGWHGLSKMEIILIFTIPASLGLFSGIVVMFRDMNIAKSMATGIIDALLSVPISIGLLLLIGELKVFYLRGKLTSFVTTILIFGIVGFVNGMKQQTGNKKNYKKAISGFAMGFILGWIAYEILQIV